MLELKINFPVEPMMKMNNLSRQSLPAPPPPNQICHPWLHSESLCQSAGYAKAWITKFLSTMTPVPTTSRLQDWRYIKLRHRTTVIIYIYRLYIHINNINMDIRCNTWSGKTRRKGKRSDSVLWQNTIRKQKNPKSKVTTHCKRHQKLRLRTDLGR